MFKKCLSILLAACMLLSLAACGSSDTGDAAPGDLPPSDGISGQPLAVSYAVDNVFSLCYDPDYPLNPISQTCSDNLLIASLMYENAYEISDDLEAVPNLITSYVIHDDEGLSWSFYVDTSVTFHDGSSLTAYDVAYSIQRAMQFPQYSSRLSVIYGITAMSDDMFMISLNSPNTQLPKLLAIPVIKKGGAGEHAPLGTGPYMLNEAGDALVTYDGHRNAASMPIDTIYLKSFDGTERMITAYEDSEIDLVINDPTGITNFGYASTNETRYYDTTSMHYLGFNVNTGLFLFIACRYAMNFGVDREYIVNDLMDGCGTVATLPMHPRAKLYNTNFASNFTYDLEHCRQAFAAAEVEDYDNDGLAEHMVTGIPLEITIDFIVFADSMVKVAAAHKIAEDLESLGIRVNVRELSWEEYNEALEEGTFDMYYGEVKFNPDFDLTELLTEDGTLNFGGISDAAGYNTMIDPILSAKDDASRQVASDLLYQYIANQAPIVPICFERRAIMTHRGVVSGIDASQYNVFRDIQNWTIELD